MSTPYSWTEPYTGYGLLSKSPTQPIIYKQLLFFYFTSVNSSRLCFIPLLTFEEAPPPPLHKSHAYKFFTVPLQIKQNVL